MNMLAIRCGDDIIVVDAGMLFPGSELLGVDFVVPDISYLLDNREHLRGLVVTHGHEDHIGAVPYVLSQLEVPVYTTGFASALIRRRLKEHDLEHEPAIHVVRPQEKITLGCFEIEFIHVNARRNENFVLVSGGGVEVQADSSVLSAVSGKPSI